MTRETGAEHEEITLVNFFGCGAFGPPIVTSSPKQKTVDGDSRSARDPYRVVPPFAGVL